MSNNLSPPSCLPKDPFVQLEEGGKASILNYNLPQSACYQIDVPMGIGIPESYFGTIQPPSNNFWDQVDRLTKEEIVSRLLDEMQFAVKNPIFGNRDVLMKDGVIRMNRDHKSLERMQITKEARQIDKLNLEVEKVVMEPSIAGVNVSEIADKITKGFKPVLERNIVGTVKIIYVPKPIQLIPEIILTLKLKSCSYLGDYGAGQTLKTFSLLPGEKTTITIRNWERNETTKKEASSVLDSISESSANELQTIVNQEASSSMSQGITNTTEYEVNADVKLRFPKVGIDISGGVSNSNTFSSAVESSVSSLVNSTSTQVAKADSMRQVEINTETTSTNTTETEETVVRTLENINKSRVLNFVFRQMLQEFYTITYLDDVSITYSTGYKEQQITTNLAGLQGLLNQVIPDSTDRDKVLVAIINRLSNITDYEGTKHSFIECVEENLTANLDCECLPTIPAELVCYLRKKKGLTQTYDDKTTVKGIILDVTHRVVRTPALVVDALLGQGEALDCFNLQLQNEAVKSAQLANELTQQQILNTQYEGEMTKAQVDTVRQQIDLLESIKENGVDNAAQNYKKVFGPCCEVPQSGCGCGNCNENPKP